MRYSGRSFDNESVNGTSDGNRLADAFGRFYSFIYVLVLLGNAVPRELSMFSQSSSRRIYQNGEGLRYGARCAYNGEGRGVGTVRSIR